MVLDFYLCPNNGTFQRSASSEIKSELLWIPRKALLFFEARAISSFKDLKQKIENLLFFITFLTQFSTRY